ncbi:hypothetical protein CKO25_05305 [Thiocapsa imhoffii]|uniref:Uncharacterized protein n=1 Tax=Thiocapsa imhoffii TaxID=382777 RepID=A0A9X0WH99_9GAMM|nr:hypothetical protein [Thiocapsa imhoffii]MBK1644077.1 hypothetical protein [Thiocapsa imhoffii]
MVMSEKLIARDRALKVKLPGCLLLLQAKPDETAAFMPVMDEDARAVSAVTGLTIQTSRREALAPWLRSRTHPIDWIAETGRPFARIAERVVTVTWSARPVRLGAASATTHQP